MIDSGGPTHSFQWTKLFCAGDALESISSIPLRSAQA